MPRSYIVAYFVYIILSFGVLQVVEFIYVKFVSRTYIYICLWLLHRQWKPTLQTSLNCGHHDYANTFKCPDDSAYSANIHKVASKMQTPHKFLFQTAPCAPGHTTLGKTHPINRTTFICKLFIRRRIILYCKLQQCQSVSFVFIQKMLRVGEARRRGLHVPYFVLICTRPLQTGPYSSVYYNTVAL